MSITLKSLVSRAVEMALVGVEDQSSYIQTAEMLAETLVPQVAQATVRDAAGDPFRFQQTLKTLTLSFTDGAATVPSTMFTEYLSQSTISDPADDNAALYTSWCKNWQDFLNRDTTLGAYTMRTASTLYYAPYGTEWTPGGADNFGGDLEVTVPCNVTIPTNPTEEIDISSELEDQLIVDLASSIRSGPGWQSLSTRLPIPGDVN